MTGRVAVVLYPDWPLVAAGHCPDAPVAITRKQRVYACSVAAQKQGVNPGSTVSQAFALCPDLITQPADSPQEAAQFGVVAAHCAAATPFVDVVTPGVLAIRSPLLPRETKEESTLLQALCAALDEAAHLLLPCHTYHHLFQIGVADTLFAALVAANSTPLASRLTCVPPGKTASFVQTQPVGVLKLLTLLPEVAHDSRAIHTLINDCHTVGIDTCEEFVTLDKTVLVDRFGSVAGTVYGVLAGSSFPATTQPYQLEKRDFSQNFTPCLDDIHAASFSARQIFDEALRTLEAAGKACNRVVLEVTTDNNERHVMAWQARESFTAPMLQDRLRWQLEGWSKSSSPPTAGITDLTVRIEQTVSGITQPTLLADGTDTVRQSALEQAASRIDALLGEGALRQPYRSSHRHPAQWVQTQPFSSQSQILPPQSRRWTNAVPPPAPATLYTPARPAVIEDSHGELVTVTQRGLLTGTPYLLRLDSGRQQQIVTYAGPWLSNERWWERTPKRAARFQIVTADGFAYLAAQRFGSWFLEALYD